MAQQRDTDDRPVWGEVLHTEHLTPSMVRIILGGGELERFEASPHSDAYINPFFLAADSPIDVPFDPQAAKDGPVEHRPHRRRITVRRWEAAEHRLWLDFVVHGDDGYAGPWASRAKPGDRLQFTGPSGSYSPDPAAAWHLMVGDESALPAIAASLEAMQPGARCVVVAVVDGPEHELSFESPGDIEIAWLHRRGAADPESLLPDTVAALDFAPGPVDVFVHGEAGEVRAVRRHLLTERGIRKEDTSISPYWRRRYTDERWREIKKQWLAEQTDDA